MATKHEQDIASFYRPRRMSVVEKLIRLPFVALYVLALVVQSEWSQIGGSQ